MINNVISCILVCLMFVVSVTATNGQCNCIPRAQYITTGGASSPWNTKIVVLPPVDPSYIVRMSYKNKANQIVSIDMYRDGDYNWLVTHPSELKYFISLELKKYGLDNSCTRYPIYVSGVQYGPDAPRSPLWDTDMCAQVFFLTGQSNEYSQTFQIIPDLHVVAATFHYTTHDGSPGYASMVKKSLDGWSNHWQSTTNPPVDMSAHKPAYVTLVYSNGITKTREIDFDEPYSVCVDEECVEPNPPEPSTSIPDPGEHSNTPPPSTSNEPEPYPDGDTEIPIHNAVSCDVQSVNDLSGSNRMYRITMGIAYTPADSIPSVVPNCFNSSMINRIQQMTVRVSDETSPYDNNNNQHTKMSKFVLEVSINDLVMCYGAITDPYNENVMRIASLFMLNKLNQDSVPIYSETCAAYINTHTNGSSSVSFGIDKYKTRVEHVYTRTLNETHVENGLMVCVKRVLYDGVHSITYMGAIRLDNGSDTGSVTLIGEETYSCPVTSLDCCWTYPFVVPVDRETGCVNRRDRLVFTVGADLSSAINGHVIGAVMDVRMCIGGRNTTLDDGRVPTASLVLYRNSERSMEASHFMDGQWVYAGLSMNGIHNIEQCRLYRLYLLRVSTGCSDSNQTSILYRREDSYNGGTHIMTTIETSPTGCTTTVPFRFIARTFMTPTRNCFITAEWNYGPNSDEIMVTTAHTQHLRAGVSRRAYQDEYVSERYTIDQSHAETRRFSNASFGVSINGKWPPGPIPPLPGGKSENALIFFVVLFNFLIVVFVVLVCRGSAQITFNMDVHRDYHSFQSVVVHGPMSTFVSSKAVRKRC